MRRESVPRRRLIRTRTVVLVTAVVAVVLTLLVGRILKFQAPSAGPSVSGPTPGATGMIIASIEGQVATLDLETFAVRVLTAFNGSVRAVDVSGGPSLSFAVASVLSPPPAGQVGQWGGDLLSVEFASGRTTPLVTRRDEGESLLSPTWSRAHGGLLFERDDLNSEAVAYPRQIVARFSSRIEFTREDGSSRSVLADNARAPAAAPNGDIAFIRTNAAGTALVVRSVAGDERLLVQQGTFYDIGIPRYAPTADKIAFVATSDRRAAADLSVLAKLLGTRIAHAHGLPWDLWTVRSDGTGLSTLAAVAADDASIAWSPDGTKVFVIGDTGSFLVSVSTAEVTRVPQFSGSGAIAWLPTSQ